MANPEAVENNKANKILNTSGKGSSAPVPNLVAKKFNWGAFLWGWIWGICHGAWITLLGLAIPIVLGVIAASMQIQMLYLKIISNLIGLGLGIWFGIMGNTWAWQNKRYHSIQEFHEKQKKWVKAWFFIIGGLFLLGILAALFIPALMRH